MIAMRIIAPFAALALLSQTLPEYYLVVLCYIGLATINVVGLVLLTGGAGITSFGQAAFVGIGAYTTGYLTSHLGYTPFVGLLAGLFVTAAAALILGAVTLSLSGHYLAISTIAWGISLFFVFGNVEALGGHTGMSGIPPISIAGFDLSGSDRMFWLIWSAAILCMVATTNILNSRMGRSLYALKSNPLTAESFGVNTTSAKIQVFVYAALLSSLSGWLYAHLSQFINPTPFGLNVGVEYQFMAVIGGVNSVWGALAGSAFVLIAKEYLQTAIAAVVGIGGNFEIIIFGILVLVLLRFNRDAGITSQLARRLRRQLPVVSMPEKILPLRAKGESVGPLLQVVNVTKRYGGLTAVDNISFDIHRKEIVALVGPNGAGKTTLFNLISGADSADQGEIVLGETVITGLPARKIVGLGAARTFQHVHLVAEASALENVMLGAHLRSDRGLVAAAMGIQLEQERMLRWEAYSHLKRVGLEMEANTPAQNLALGQQRILEIARALAADPELLLLDEAAAGLRDGEKKELSALISLLRAEGRSILLVEHDMNFVMDVADRVIVMNFGQKLASGTAHEIQRDPHVIKVYLGEEEA